MINGIIKVLTLQCFVYSNTLLLVPITLIPQTIPPLKYRTPTHMYNIGNLSYSTSLQPKMEKLYTVSKKKKRLRADHGSDHELLIAKFKHKLKKVGKTTSPLRYDLNYILNDCTVEMRNRFKGLDLIDRVPDELWTEVCNTVKETRIKTIPKKKKCKKAKWLSEESL